MYHEHNNTITLQKKLCGTCFIKSLSLYTMAFITCERSELIFPTPHHDISERLPE